MPGTVMSSFTFEINKQKHERGKRRVKKELCIV